MCRYHLPHHVRQDEPRVLPPRAAGVPPEQLRGLQVPVRAGGAWGRGGSRITLSRKLWLPALRLTRVGEDGGRGDDHAEAVRNDGVRLGVAARLVRAHVTRDGVGEAVTEVDLVSTS